MQLDEAPKPGELLETAIRRGKKIPLAGKSANPVSAIKRRQEKRVKEMADYAIERLKGPGKKFPDVSQLHPFYQEMLKATVDVNRLKKALAQLNKVADLVKRLRVESVKALYRAKNRDTVFRESNRFLARFDSMLSSLEESVSFLNDARKKIRELPDIDFEAPTVILAGYPNVGKSTVLRRLTGSAPEVAAYPFTTKGLKLGYFEHRFSRIQVVDTPGLLDRAKEKRNPVERKAVAALTHLPKLAVFVFDASGQCGYTVEQQKSLFAALKKEFVVPFLSVANKADLASAAEIGALGADCVSGEGVESDLKERVAAAVFRKGRT